MSDWENIPAPIRTKLENVGYTSRDALPRYYEDKDGWATVKDDAVLSNAEINTIKNKINFNATLSTQGDNYYLNIYKI